MPVEIALCASRLPDLSLDQILTLASRGGYQAVELAAAHLPPPQDAAAWRRLAGQLEKQGLAAAALRPEGFDFARAGDAECEQALQALTAYLDAAAELECDLVGVTPGGPADPREAREDHWGRAAHYLAEACDLALGRGGGLLVETAPGLAATVDSALELCSRVDRPNLGLAYAPAHLAQAVRYWGVEALARFAELVWQIRLPQEAAPPRPATERWAAVAQWLAGSDFDGLVVLTGDRLSGPEEAARESRLLREWLQRAGP